MMDLRWIILGSLVVVVVLQLLNRVVGAAAAVLWSVALLVYGGWALNQGQHVAFLGVAVPRWLFAGFMLSMIAYNVWALVRALRARRPRSASS